jgi:hypothetical protein
MFFTAWQLCGVALRQHRIYNKKEKGAASPKAEYA